MSAYIVAEAQLALHSFLLGIILMISYDLLRLFRFFIPHGNLWTGLEDFAYWSYAAVMTFSLLFRENNGILRGYVIACVFAGMFLYDRIVSRSAFGLLKNVRGWIRIRTRNWKIRRESRKNGNKPQ
ncbi:MAG: spore cortex biosynthesis protein YabQ [Lachnospiraceae bacterium]|nr:spore cortex biosynthesis protein YabQ [Lachnospiraceae bacterium]